MRFDGVRFHVFNRTNTPAISNNRLGTLFVDPAGRLWVYPETHEGVVLYENGHSVLLSACDDTTSSCPAEVTGPTVPNYSSPHPWKQYELSHTYAAPGTYPVKVMINDGGPNGFVSYSTTVFATGAGQITGPSEFEGGSEQTFSLSTTLQTGSSLQASVSCGIGTEKAWDNSNFTCAFGEVGAATTSAVSVTGMLGSQAFTRSHNITVLPKPIVLSEPSGPTTVESGALATYTYQYSGPGSSVATTTFTPACPGTLFTSGTGTFTCRVTASPGAAQVGIQVDTSLGQRVHWAAADKDGYPLSTSDAKSAISAATWSGISQFGQWPVSA